MALIILWFNQINVILELLRITTQPNSESIPRFTRNKYKHKPVKGKQQNTASCRGTWHYGVLCKKERYSERRYKSQLFDKFNAFYSTNTKRELDWHISKRNTAVNKLYNTKKKMQKQMGALKK